MGFGGGLPSTAVRAREKGQFGPQGDGVVPKCCGVRVVQAAVGAPVGSAVVHVVKSSINPAVNTVTAAFAILKGILPSVFFVATAFRLLLLC